MIRGAGTPSARAAITNSRSLRRGLRRASGGLAAPQAKHRDEQEVTAREVTEIDRVLHQQRTVEPERPRTGGTIVLVARASRSKSTGLPLRRVITNATSESSQRVTNAWTTREMM
jgi:hypothetical protein